MYLDIEKLKKDMENDSLGAFYGGGFGGAMMEAFDIQRADPQELVDMALQKGWDLNPYVCGDDFFSEK